MPATLYKGKFEEKEILFTRVWAMPNHQTFLIHPIAELLKRYIPKKPNAWADPFAGANSSAQFTNDLNPDMPTRWHKEALDFACENLGDRTLNGVLFDPLYSFRQISEHYRIAGRKATR